MTQFKNAVLRLDQRHDLNDCNATIDVDGHSAIAEVVVRMEGQTEDSPELVAFAGRLVACYNLLHGYPTDALDGVTLAEFVVKHPELAEKALIAAYSSLFADRGATNYLEVKGARPELGPFTITLQRTEGLTPVEKLEAMTKQRDVLLEAVHATRRLMSNSEGVACWRKNGDIDSWDELLPEVAAALEFVEGEQS